MSRAPSIGGLLVAAVLTGALAPGSSAAQDARSPREAAPIDLTGQWVAIVNEDWRWRMVTPAKGDYESMPLSAAGRAAADLWDPATDGSCKAYGAAGLLRMPTRLRIAWSGDDVLELQTDAGRQTRTLRFDGAGAAPAAGASLQGVSTAAWREALVPRGRRGPAPVANQAERGGQLVVTTSQLSAGWLRRNGVPYSEQTTMTEYFDRFPAPNGDEWLVVTTVVDDPVYLNGPYVTSSHFRREQDRGNWNPRACRADS